jgi:hypothetical protein
MITNRKTIYSGYIQDAHEISWSVLWDLHDVKGFLIRHNGS